MREIPHRFLPRSPLFWALFAAPALCLLLMAGCGPRPPVAGTASVTAAGVAAVARFLGDASCRECHEKEFGAHAASRHSITLRPADATSLGPLAPPVGRIPGTPYEIQREGDKFFFASTEGERKRRELHYALGSGNLGMTYITYPNDQTLSEIRMSYFPRTGKWYITPGQEQVADNDTERPMEHEVSRQCVGCHSSSVPAGQAKPDPKLMGVGCEACHGPGSAHIDAARVPNQTDFKMARLKELDGHGVNALCGKCHRAPEQVELSGFSVIMTQRFQAYGLAQSPCFQKSNGALSCLTCHGAHDNAARDTEHYTKACLTCHASSPPPDAKIRAAVCPVNPTQKCVSCHMPKRKVFPMSKVDISMADHLIWAVRKKKQ